MTSACGTVEHELRRGRNIVWQDMDITREVREQKLGQHAQTVWFTGLSGAGKSTLANALEKRLMMMGRHTMILDGDNVRHGLNNNLGFTDSDRSENIRRIAEAAKLLNDAGIIVMVSCIAPYDRDRRNAKKIIGDSFKEIYVSTSIEECEKRDVKGLYEKARKIEIPNFTGVSGEYQIPDCADVVIDTTDRDVEECVDEIMDKLDL
ncbi:MAG: adenylyl-sulfate kinase [Lachnospiraceae bacterium]|nr:adenylyl-sulfate kinase [Lachnospiraceae bacterium]